MKRKQYRIVIAMVVMLGLTGCVSNTVSDSGLVSEEPTVYPDVTMETDKTENYQEETENSVENTDSDKDTRIGAYISALENLNVNHVFPSGDEAGAGLDPDYDMSENKFAVYDVDGDGKEELIIQFTTTCVAGMVEYIYDYDNESKEMREQFLEFPSLTFYDNGVIKAGWSHNQGLAGDFWPYTLYQYEKETDTYTEIGNVDAWDKSYFEQDFSGNPFPDDIDADGDGIVYYLMLPNNTSETTPVDGKEYNEWFDSFLNGSQELNVPFMDLTDENIQNVRGNSSGRSAHLLR